MGARVFLKALYLHLGDSIVPEDETLDSAGLLPPRRCGGANHFFVFFYKS